MCGSLHPKLHATHHRMDGILHSTANVRDRISLVDHSEVLYFMSVFKIFQR